MPIISIFDCFFLSINRNDSVSQDFMCQKIRFIICCHRRSLCSLPIDFFPFEPNFFNGYEKFDVPRRIFLDRKSWVSYKIPKIFTYLHFNQYRSVFTLFNLKMFVYIFTNLRLFLMSWYKFPQKSFLDTSFSAFLS